MTSLEELVAFNDEVSAMTRAGAPIDLGLSQLSHDPDDAIEQINAVLTRRVEKGVSLVDALSEEDESLPAIYQSVVGAGLRCGRLPAAFEALTGYTQALRDVGQSLRSAMVYPLVICALAYSMFVGSCLFVPPNYYSQMADMGSGGGTVTHMLQVLRDSLPYWVAIPPVLLTALLSLDLRSNLSRTVWFRGLPPLFRWLPGVSRVTADQRCASLAELLALLVEHEVPLQEGLQLAARASGDSKLTAAAQQMAQSADRFQSVDRGESSTQKADAARHFPPFLRWALTSPLDTDDLARNLRIASRTYRQRAEQQAKRIRAVMPMLTCVVLAGSVTLLYCLSVFVPLVRLINELS